MDDARALLQRLLDRLDKERSGGKPVPRSRAVGAAIREARALLDGPADQPEAVAHLWQHEETGRTVVLMPDQQWTASPSWLCIGPLYLGDSAPAVRKPKS